MDARVGHQVSLELSHIHVQGTVKAQGRRQRGDNLYQLCKSAMAGAHQHCTCIVRSNTVEI